MAERKYELAVQEKRTSNAFVNKSWYKERLKTKYMKQLKPGERLITYDAKNWLFLRRGLDDFRDGLPPIGSRLTEAEKTVVPRYQKDYMRFSELKMPPVSKHLNRYQTYLTKKTPIQQQQQNYLTTVEEGLLLHPLALFPHLEQSVSPEVFEAIINILDPQFNVLDIREEDMDIEERLEESTEVSPWGSGPLSFPLPEEDKMKPDQPLGSEAVLRNMYKWISPKEKLKDSKKSNEREKAWATEQTEGEHIKKVTEEFCDWVSNLGGETNNIEESTITSLFASGYETKPALSVPIHVVDLANVPHELRLSAMVPPPAPPEKSVCVSEMSKKTAASEHEPTFVKFRYGAWYLPPKSWKKLGYYEPLEDPTQLKENEMSEAKKESKHLTEELATMHASKAFNEFINRKSTRKPEFLVEISEIQRKAALEEEQRKLSETLLKQRKS
ncbi:hypothetical protein BsWGS_17550 [Bradybaena similaris]